MDSGYIIVLAVLILGGVIATVGDRIGTRVGKKRLSLFKLRPKHTAVLITIITGVGISLSTLGIIFLVDKNLRRGILELEHTQNDLRRERKQLKKTEAQKRQVEEKLSAVKQQQVEAQEALRKINKTLERANAKQRVTQAQLEDTLTRQAQTENKLQRTTSQLTRVVEQYEQARSELQNVYNQRNEQLKRIEQLKVERKRLVDEIEQARVAIEQRDREITSRNLQLEDRDRKILELDKRIQKRNSEIKAREQEIAQRQKIIEEKQNLLKDLRAQQQFLQQQLGKLGESNQELRRGKLALFRGQVLAEAVVSVKEPTAARQAVVRLLQEASRNAINRLREPGFNKINPQPLYVTKSQVRRLSREIDDGREYVVRIFSAENYVKGEKRIEIFADATPNEIVFSREEVLAATTANPKKMTSYQLRQRVELLITASQFRARSAGILKDVEIDSTFLRFIDQLSKYDQELDIKAISVRNTYTEGPLKVKLIATNRKGEVIFSS
ncbi:DUF3084 domain-containing protein [Mastigocoleus testarum]|uniref:Polynucleotidyl transferase n=1 Tax=Mastigocoleus testarum BC008 TaxID=371196 RepID=A0A0V7ZIP0_9CYAN|nr:DUF3084 domain-containing protein [Mastigocoleus testarum]KST64289.1 hypothetical protein BC008_16765 [Mastigocoleus testarum BC008]